MRKQFQLPNTNTNIWVTCGLELSKLCTSLLFIFFGKLLYSWPQAGESHPLRYLLNKKFLKRVCEKYGKKRRSQKHNIIMTSKMYRNLSKFNNRADAEKNWCTEDSEHILLNSNIFLCVCRKLPWILNEYALFTLRYCTLLKKKNKIEVLRIIVWDPRHFFSRFENLIKRQKLRDRAERCLYF